MIDTVDQASGTPSRVSDIRRWQIVLGSIVVAMLIGTTIWFVHWRSSLRPFQTYPTYGFGSHPKVGETIYLGEEVLVANHTGVMTVHIDSIHPRVTENTADADVVVLRCTLSGLRDFGLGGERIDSAKLVCAKLTPFRSGTVNIRPAKGGEDLVVAVTPRRAGIVRLSGVDITFTSGLRHGSQHVGAQAWIATP